MMFLVDRELVDQEEKLATGGSVSLLALETTRLRPSSTEISVSQSVSQSTVRPELCASQVGTENSQGWAWEMKLIFSSNSTKIKLKQRMEITATREGFLILII